jgi:enoyl-CoA hydratase/carnithine racemase
MTTDVLLIEKKNLKVGTIEQWTLNRPDKYNSLNSTVIKRLETEGRRLQAEVSKNLLSVRALVLTGSGEKAFAAGADIAEMDDFDRSQAINFSKAGQAAFGRLEELPIPCIAAVNGFALGGGLELALCCDFIVSNSAGVFGQPESHLGLIPGFGATVRFVERLGTQKGFEYLMSGKKIKADEGVRLGLVDKLLPEGKNLIDGTFDFIEELISKAGPVSIARMKKIIRAQKEKLYVEGLESEAKCFAEMFDTLDKEEGVTAFLEKRNPQFKGR